ncbi:MAG TPA: hypothetical protein ENG78_05235 [Acidiferrobacteraceae bacterium]|nr:hypothetical protein [Acidiferrobacteraceae bacterium]HEX20205.1 hypothetical protein [Acidiferrobacteraceae bacterium]
MMTGQIQYPTPLRQRGAVLVVTLVILLLLTILGVSSLNMSSLETLITRNDQQKQASFQATEGALRQGQVFALTLTSPPITTNTLASGVSNKGIYVYVPGSSSNLDYTTLNWDSNDSIDLGNGSAYVIEYMGWRPAAGSDAENRTLYYRIIAHSSSGTTNTILESTLGVASG